MMPDRSVAVRLLLCTWLAAALPPPNTNNQHPTHQERKFGGYRIVPKPCKDTTSTSEVGGKAKTKSQGEGVCMFNYECAQREGTVIGSCMDGFLFGACCRLPPGVAITQHDITSPHSTTMISSPSISSQTVESITYSVRPMTYKPTAETVLLHKNGSAVHDSNSPEEFEAFTKPLTRATSPRPEFSTFSYVSGTGEILPDTRWTTRNPQKSTVWVSATKFTSDNFSQSTNEVHYESSSSPFKKPINDDEENMIRIPTFSVNSQDVEDATNAASINHILNILNDTVPVKPPSITSHQSAGLSTWVSVNGRPEKTSTATYYSPSSKVNLTTVPSVKSPYSTTTTSSTTHFYSPTSSSSIFNKSPTKPLYATSTTTNYFYYDKKKPERLGSSTTTQKIVGPSFQVTPQVKITSKPPAAGQQQQQQQQQEPAPTVIVLGPLNPVTTKRPPVTESTTTTIVSIKPQVTGTLITVKPQSTPDPHKPLYTQIILPRPDVVITTSTNGQKPTDDIYTTAKPKPKPTRPRPPVSEAGTYITAKPQLPVNQKPLFQRPDASSTQQPITGSTELLVAFPPVRDPNVNLTAVQQDEILQTTVDDQDDSTPHFTVDENLDDKVHGFVEKIVQSLEGNFVDLENVLLDGQARPNITVSQEPIKRPVSTSTIRPLAQSTPTKRPTKLPNQRPTPATLLGSRPTSSQRPTSARPTPTRPSSRPTTVAVITRPPPTSSTLSTPRPKPKPPSTTVLLFQPGSTSTTTTINKPYNKRPPVSSTTILVDHIAVDQYSSSSTLSSSSYAASTQTTTNEPIKTSTELDYRRECGVRPLMKNGRIVGGKGATFGEWPWQVLVREATWLGLFTKNKCGGVLITNKYVITAAHCQPGFLASLVAVFGEYDISGEFESKRSVSRNVRRVIVHRQYDPATFENDIALLELETPVQFDSHIVPICMPQDDDDFTGRMATVTGWGRLKYGGGVPSVLQEVHVPVMENAVCQEMFQTAGHTKSILNSFLCAGYANGQRDSCEGDSGGPLMVEREDGHWVLAGTVSHGIKCAAPYLPGVYMRTTFYKPWLQSITGVRSF
ncbi:serine protease filzig [Nilaparvata lugens]|uniref:serine protease filzig n=1 Tax=Nilaparvata lugens TaxID=108931 RepID=UPI00193E4079|nr:serine protease filzig [Nilaparvata lugens]XP_039299262.1 serine protease filzig [Nilaparvata lugens]